MWAVNSSVAQSYYRLSNDVKVKLSRKFRREMTLFASAFSKLMKVCACLFLFNKPIKRLHFCVCSVLNFMFQGHMKVALNSTTQKYCSVAFI